jgi:type IV secretion system protein VirB10
MVSEHRVQDPASAYQVMAGTVIPAALMTGINSDLPGVVLATVTEPMYDSRLGRYLLIPQGTRLIGEYASQIAFGQRRVFLAWNRLVFPDATSLTLDRLPGVDSAGNAGLEDGIDRHWNQLLAGAALSTLIGVAAELAAPDRSSGQQVVVAPSRASRTASIRSGRSSRRRTSMSSLRSRFPARVIVSKDLVLRPYQPLFIQRTQP